MRKRVFFGSLFLAALIAWSLQPWRFHYAGYARTDVAVAGGTLRFDLVDQAGREPRAHCLSYLFRTSEPGDEPIAITLDRVATSRQPLREHLRAAGRTEGIPHSAAVDAFFQAPNVGGLAVPFDDPLMLEGTVLYKGTSHPFRTQLQLRRWHKDLAVTSFCAG